MSGCLTDMGLPRAAARVREVNIGGAALLGLDEAGLVAEFEPRTLGERKLLLKSVGYIRAHWDADGKVSRSSRQRRRPGNGGAGIGPMRGVSLPAMPTAAGRPRGNVSA